MPEQRPSTKPQETLIIVDSEKTSGSPAETIIKKGVNGESEPFVQGRSKCMVRLLETLRRTREVDTAVMLIGEAGTGKKMIARGLHEKSPRRQENFIAVNCSSLPEQVLKRDLFGHGSGTFTGTFRGGPLLRSGKIASAQGGTIYLDKIDGLSLSLQDKFLDVLQAGNIVRPGCDEPKPLDIRVIASTKENLKNACAEGKFREDLFYRLNVIQIALPSLHERLKDIPLLFQHFALTACSKYHLSAPPMTRELFQELLTADWPGNVRELKNVAERFALGFGLDIKYPIDHEKWMGRAKQNLGHKKPLAEKVNAFEKNLIAQELARTNGSVKETYLTLGVPRKTFYDKMHKHGLKRQDFLSVPGLPGKHLAFFR